MAEPKRSDQWGFLTKKRVAAALTIAVLWNSLSLAQSGAPVSDTELSKEAENPLHHAASAL